MRSIKVYVTTSFLCIYLKNNEKIKKGSSKSCILRKRQQNFAKSHIHENTLSFKRYGPFLWMGFNRLKSTELLRDYSLLYTTNIPVCRSWYSFDQPRKGGRLSRPRSHSVVLNPGSLNRESSALTTKPSLHDSRNTQFFLIVSWACKILNSHVRLKKGLKYTRQNPKKIRASLILMINFTSNSLLQHIVLK